MSVIDEVWTDDMGTLFRTEDGRIQWMRFGDGRDLHRAHLAACAPEAMNMLLAHEWHCGPDGEQVCISCDACEHEVDCAWLALMVKAGLR